MAHALKEKKKKSPLRVTRAGERRPSTAREYRHSTSAAVGRAVGGSAGYSRWPKKRTTGAAFMRESERKSERGRGGHSLRACEN